jgi:hypothetical protein
LYTNRSERLLSDKSLRFFSLPSEDVLGWLGW